MTAGLTAPPLRFGDAGYDEGRAAWNRNVHQTPAAVVMAENALDVRSAVRFARAEGRGVGVMATGHGAAVPSDGGVLVNTSRMRAATVDPATRTAGSAPGRGGPMSSPAPPPTAWRACRAPARASASSATRMGGGFGWLGRRTASPRGRCARPRS